MADDVSKSWFCTFNNPIEHGYLGEPHEILERLRQEWIEVSPSRTGAWAYCISADGLHHVHMVLEDIIAMRFTAIKKSYAIGMHFEPTKGNKDEAVSYIKKQGKYAEKGETVLLLIQHGDIKGAQGARRDISIIEKFIEQGKTPSEILDMSILYRRYEKLIRDCYFSKRNKETPFVRDVKVYWHVGESGSGKSYTATKLINEYGEDNFYFVTDYDNGFMDKYCGEKVLFLDEYRGQFRYSTLLTLLQGYKTQVHARYTNALALWDEVHITSVLPPDLVYRKMVSDDSDRTVDTFEQLRRRITDIIYHYKDENGYQSMSIPASEYTNYDNLIRKSTPIKITEMPKFEHSQHELPF